jgi:hypothetical protein
MLNESHPGPDDIIEIDNEKVSEVILIYFIVLSRLSLLAGLFQEQN